MQFYTRDWLGDLDLRGCSPLARSVLIDLMALAHEGTPYGHISDKSGPLDSKFLASRLNLSIGRLGLALDELRKAERIHMHAGGGWYIKRMVIDEEVRIKRAEGGKKSKGNPLLRGEGYPSDAKEGIAPSDSDSDIVSVELKPSSSENTPTRARAFPPGYEFDEGYAEFRRSYMNLQAATVDPEDFIGKAWHEWKLLDGQQRLDAVEGLVNLKRAIDDGAVDRAFVKLPENYIHKRDWRRPIIAPQARKSAKTEAMEAV
jgi:hypothetical protein